MADEVTGPKSPYTHWFDRCASDQDRDDLFYPVNVEITKLSGSYKAAVDAILDAYEVEGSFFLMDPDEVSLLQLLAEDAAYDKPLTTILYRKSGTETDPAPVVSGRPVWEILDIGPPAAFASPEARKRDRQSFDKAMSPPSTREPIVAVIDDAIPFLHERTRDGGGKTRFDAIWIQSTVMPRPSADLGLQFVRQAGFDNLGRSDQTAIDDLLDEIDAGRCDEASVYRQVYDRLFAPDHRRALCFAQSHGAAVLDVAGGFGPDEAGPRPHLMGVQLPPHAVADTSGKTFEAYVVMAIRWLVNRAVIKNLMSLDVSYPLIINLSFGSLAGSKDTLGYLETAMAHEMERFQYLLEIHQREAPIRFVLPFGNSYYRDQVALCRFGDEGDEGGEDEVDWRIQMDDRTPSFLELRASVGARNAPRPPVRPTRSNQQAPLTLSVEAPNGVALSFADMAPGTWKEAPDAPWLRVYRLADDGREKQRGAFVIAVAPTRHDALSDAPTAPAGAWKIKISATASAQVSLQIQRDDTPYSHRPGGRQSYLDHRRSRTWDPAMRRYRGLDQGPITHAGAHSARAVVASVAPEQGRAYAVGATRLRGRATDEDPLNAPGPSLYASAGEPEHTDEIKAYVSALDGPDVSAIADRGPSLSGVRAAGVLSGSTSAFAGSSLAAPQIARRLAELLSSEPLPADEELAALCDPNWMFDRQDARRGHGVAARLDRLL